MAGTEILEELEEDRPGKVALVLLTTGVLLGAVTPWPWASSSSYQGVPTVTVHGGYAAVVVAGIGALVAVAAVVALVVDRELPPAVSLILGVLAFGISIGNTATCLHHANVLEGALAGSSPSGQPAIGSILAMVLSAAVVAASVASSRRRYLRDNGRRLTRHGGWRGEWADPGAKVP